MKKSGVLGGLALTVCGSILFACSRAPAPALPAPEYERYELPAWEGDENTEEIPAGAAGAPQDAGLEHPSSW